MSKKLTKEKEAIIEAILHQLPGYRWMKANQQRFDDLASMNALQSANLAWKAVRYRHLNSVISGNYVSDEAKKERQNRWIMNIRTQARTISHKTDMPYEKVFILLYRRMVEELTR